MKQKKLLPKKCFKIKKIPHPGPLIDGELSLVLVATGSEQLERGSATEYKFHMIHTDNRMYMGFLDLRLGDNETLFYDGNIGYGVEPDFRGHHYAARSCRLIFPFSKRLGIRPLWITCQPNNSASRKTCERLGGIFTEIVDTDLIFRDCFIIFFML